MTKTIYGKNAKLVVDGTEIEMIQKTIDKSNQEIVKEKLFLFTSPARCPPCRQFHKVLDKYLEEFPQFKEQIIIYNIDDSENLKLAEEYGVTSIPTLFIVNCDKVVLKENRGTMDYENFKKFMEDFK